jgi:hypothetical protein
LENVTNLGLSLFHLVTDCHGFASAAAGHRAYVPWLNQTEISTGRDKLATVPWVASVLFAVGRS